MVEKELRGRRPDEGVADFLRWKDGSEPEAASTSADGEFRRTVTEYGSSPMALPLGQYTISNTPPLAPTA